MNKTYKHFFFFSFFFHFLLFSSFFFFFSVFCFSFYIDSTPLGKKRIVMRTIRKHTISRAAKSKDCSLLWEKQPFVVYVSVLMIGVLKMWQKVTLTKKLARQFSQKKEFQDFPLNLPWTRENDEVLSEAEVAGLCTMVVFNLPFQYQSFAVKDGVEKKEEKVLEFLVKLKILRTKFDFALNLPRTVKKIMQQLDLESYGDSVVVISKYFSNSFDLLLDESEHASFRSNLLDKVSYVRLVTKKTFVVRLPITSTKMPQTQVSEWVQNLNLVTQVAAIGSGTAILEMLQNGGESVLPIFASNFCLKSRGESGDHAKVLMNLPQPLLNRYKQVVKDLLQSQEKESWKNYGRFGHQPFQWISYPILLETSRSMMALKWSVDRLIQAYLLIRVQCRDPVCKQPECEGHLLNAVFPSWQTFKETTGKTVLFLTRIDTPTLMTSLATSFQMLYSLSLVYQVGTEERTLLKKISSLPKESTGTFLLLLIFFITNILLYIYINKHINITIY